MNNENTIVPTKNRLLIEPIQDDMVTASGIVIPETAERRPIRGRVVTIGDTVEGFAPGDRVIFPRYAGVEVEIDRKTYIVLADHEILGRIVGV